MKNNNNCYQDKQLIFLLVGFLLGIISYIVIERLINKNIKNKDEKIKNELLNNMNN